ncbi:MAG: GTPase HflX, partial [Caulobacteraceae bacterium]
ESLGAGPDSGRAILEVWNKVDLLPEDERAALVAREVGHPGRAHGAVAVSVSASTGEGCGRLLEALAALIDQAPPVDALLTAADGEALAWLYRHGRVIDREDEEGGEVRLSVRLDPQALGRFERLYPGVVN